MYYFNQRKLVGDKQKKARGTEGKCESQREVELVRQIKSFKARRETRRQNLRRRWHALLIFPERQAPL